MTPKMRWQAILVIVVIGLCVWRASYTIRFLSLDDAEKAQMAPEQVAALASKSLPLGLDLRGGMHLVLEVDRSGLPADEAADAMDRALEVIRNRIDQFNVAEPSIQREGVAITASARKKPSATRAGRSAARSTVRMTASAPFLFSRRCNA